MKTTLYLKDNTFSNIKTCIMIATMSNVIEIAYTQFNKATNYRNCRCTSFAVQFTYLIPFDLSLTPKLWN